MNLQHFLTPFDGVRAKLSYRSRRHFHAHLVQYRLSVEARVSADICLSYLVLSGMRYLHCVMSLRSTRLDSSAIPVLGLGSDSYPDRSSCLFHHLIRSSAQRTGWLLAVCFCLEAVTARASASGLILRLTRIELYQRHASFSIDISWK